MSTGQANLGSGKDASVRVTLDRLAHHGAVVVGLQEAGDRGDVLRAWCRDNDWLGYFGDDFTGAPSVPILWNPKAVRGVNPATTPATPPTDTGSLGVGPNKVKAKVWNHVTIRPRSGGEAFLFVNGHLPASLWAPRRRALAKKQIDVLRKIVATRRGAIDVIAVGDFNARPNDRLFKPLRHLGMRQHVGKPTKGRRIIDHVWGTHGVRGQAEVISIPSDHKGVVFNMKEKR